MSSTSTEQSTPGGTARERLLTAAGELFYREGVHTVGIDRVIERAGVAKASLYNTFGSKEELVRAYLETRRSGTMARVTAAVEARTDPRERLLAVFDAASEMIAQPGYNGCAFASATSESHAETVDEVTAGYRGWFRTLFTDLARAAGAVDPEGLAGQLHLLYDGVSLAARMDGDRQAAEKGRAAAAVLVDAAVAPGGSALDR